MALREVLLATLMERFGDREPRVGRPPGPIVVFPARHPAVGDVSVRDTGFDTNFTAVVAVGEIIEDHFDNFDSHLEGRERAERLSQDVARFLQEFFADRLLLWRSTDGRNAGWRERGEVGYSEPLVLDDRVYRTFLWSGPLSVWQATPTIFARGHIRDDREYQIMFVRLNDSGPDGFQGTERDVASQLVAEYEREHDV